MRALLIIAAALALPVLVVAHRQYFLAHQQPAMIARVRAALNDPMFSGIKKDDIVFNHLDVTLRGWVAEPSVREEARRRVNTVPGVRFRDEDNRLLVTPQLSGTLDGEKLTLTGWLRDENILRQVVLWLRLARPGLEFSTEAVRLSSHVARIDAPPTGNPGDKVPAFLAEVWNAIRTGPGLQITRDNGHLRASGAVPTTTLRDAIAEAAPGCDVTHLRTGAFVRKAKFTDENALPAFLHSFFASPAADCFEATAQTVRARAVATPEQEKEWGRLIAPLAEDGVGSLDLWPVAAAQLLPGYQPESKLTPEVLQTLRATLAACATHFDAGVHSISAQEMPLMGTARDAILAAGPAAKIIVAAHPDAMGDPRLNEDSSRRRAAAIASELTTRGVPSAQITTAILPVCRGPDGGDQSRCVQLLVK